MQICGGAYIFKRHAIASQLTDIFNRFWCGQRVNCLVERFRNFANLIGVQIGQLWSADVGYLKTIVVEFVESIDIVFGPSQL